MTKKTYPEQKEELQESPQMHDEPTDEVVSQTEDGAKRFDIRNVSGTPLFPVFNGEQITMYPNDVLSMDMVVYDDCVKYIASFNDGIIVTRIY